MRRTGRHIAWAIALACALPATGCGTGDGTADLAGGDTVGADPDGGTGDADPGPADTGTADDAGSGGDDAIPDTPDPGDPCLGLVADPAAAEFDLDCLPFGNCTVVAPAAPCGCGLCQDRHCVRLSDAAACADRPAVTDGQGSTTLAAACPAPGDAPEVTITASARIPDSGLLLGGKALVPGTTAGRNVFAFFNATLDVAFHDASAVFANPGVAAMLGRDSDYLVVEARAWDDGRAVLEHVPYGSLFDPTGWTAIPDGWEAVDLFPGAAGDVRVLMQRSPGDWRVQSYVPTAQAPAFGAVVDEGPGLAPGRAVETNTGRTRLVVGAADAWDAVGRDRDGGTVWKLPVPVPVHGRVRALAPAPAGGVWVGGEIEERTAILQGLDATGQIKANVMVSFGWVGLPARTSVVAIEPTADGGVLVAMDAFAEGPLGSSWQGALLRHVGPDGTLAWERRFEGWSPLSLQRNLDEVRLVATRAPFPCSLAVRLVTVKDEPRGCVPSCPAQACGDDGCGGTCAPCAAGQDCADGRCSLPDATPYPPDVTTAGFALAACDTTWATRVTGWQDRPSSGRTCYLLPPAGVPENEGTHLPCLPWETCDLGDTFFPWDPDSEHHMVGTMKCGRSCGPADPCPFGAECRPTGLPYTDYIPPDPVRLCEAPPPSVDWPPDPAGGAAAAEGGLGCWTTVADVAGENAGSRVAVVGSHVYALAWDAGAMAVDGQTVILADHVLQHVPLKPGATAADVTVVATSAGTGTYWTWLRESGGRLLAFQRPVPADVAGFSGPVTHDVLWGEPAADGQVAMVPSGVQVTLDRDNATPLPGARHGCLVRPDGDDLVLVCFPVKDGKLAKTETALGVPGEVAEYLAWYTQKTLNPPFWGRPYLLAASDGWIVAVTGDPCRAPDGPPSQVHAAPFDPDAARPTGAWQTWAMPPLFGECEGHGGVAVYRDTLVLLRGVATRLSAAGPGPWVATTPRAAGYPMDWTLAGDLLVTFDLLQLTGPGPLPGRIVANRFLW